MNFTQNTAKQETLGRERQNAVQWMKERPDIFGPPMSELEVWQRLQEKSELESAYRNLSEELQNEFFSFCMGVRGMRITYDPVFKAIFDPETRPERLEEFLSLCLGESLKILQVLPNESKRLTEEGSLLVMDILVRLESGALINVEIQRVGYLFPGPRCACYSSDLVMRQYSQIREERRQEKKRFSYQDIKKVYTIVLIQKSTSEFHQFPEEYLHYARQTFNTGLELDLLQEYLLIPLDIFLENHHNISKKLEAWLYFIASDQPQDIRKVLEFCPEFAELYREVFSFRFQPKELVSMYSDALRILDANTTQYMIEIYQEENRKLKEALKKAQEEEQRREETERQLEERQRQLEEKQRQQEKTHNQLEERERRIKEQEEEIIHMRELLSQLEAKK